MMNLFFTNAWNLMIVVFFFLLFFFRSKSQMVSALQEKSEISRKVLTVSYDSPISDSGRHRSFQTLLQVPFESLGQFGGASEGGPPVLRSWTYGASTLSSGGPHYGGNPWSTSRPLHAYAHSGPRPSCAVGGPQRSHIPSKRWPGP